MYTTILHATDLSDNHFDICKKSSEIAKGFGAKLHLLHVIQPPQTLQLAQGLGFAELSAPVKEDAETVMRVLGEALNIPPEQQHVAVGPIKMHILDIVRELGCELIIIGSHTPGPLPAFLGSTANAVVYNAPCDVLTLRVENP